MPALPEARAPVRRAGRLANTQGKPIILWEAPKRRCLARAGRHAETFSV